MINKTTENAWIPHGSFRHIDESVQDIFLSCWSRNRADLQMYSHLPHLRMNRCIFLRYLKICTFNNAHPLTDIVPDICFVVSETYLQVNVPWSFLLTVCSPLLSIFLATFLFTMKILHMEIRRHFTRVSNEVQ